MAVNNNGSFDPKAFLASVGSGRTLKSVPAGQAIFTQGDAADSLFYIQHGRFQKATLSRQGKEAVVAMLGVVARLLLLMANFGKEGTPQPILAKISQETLAEMIGTTRSRVSFFMNKFRKLGFIKYNGHLEVHSSLLSVVLRDDPPTVRAADEEDAPTGSPTRKPQWNPARKRPWRSVRAPIASAARTGLNRGGQA